MLTKNLKKFISHHKKKRLTKSLKPTERALLTFYSDFIGNNDIVFDVGANIGDRSKLFLLLDCIVYAFEPQKSCINDLKRLQFFPSFSVFCKQIGIKIKF